MDGEEGSQDVKDLQKSRSFFAHRIMNNGKSNNDDGGAPVFGFVDTSSPGEDGGTPRSEGGGETPRSAFGLGTLSIGVVGGREADGTPVSAAASAEDSFDELLAEQRMGLLQYGNPLGSKGTNEAALRFKELWNACRSRGMSESQSWGLLVIHNGHFNAFINVVILAASLAIGLETDNPQWRFVLSPLNLFCLTVFTVEVVIKLMALRAFFWVDPNDAAWNKFDFTIVIISLLDLIVGAARADSSTGGIVVVVRVFRLLRVLRTMRTLKTSSGGDLDG